MGIGGISIWQLLIVLLIVILLFGTKKLRNMGGDLGGALKNFKTAMKDGKDEAEKDKDSAKLEKAENGSEATAEQKDKVSS